jgi:hypothetical protein
MTQFAKYCRTLLAGSLVFGGAVAVSVVGASLSASPAAAASPPSHSVISREGPLRSTRPLRSNGLLESILPSLGSPINSLLGGLLDLPANGKADQNSEAGKNDRADQSSWAIEPSPNVTANSGVFKSESCSSASACVAVGYYVNKAGIQVVLAEAWNGTKWSIEKLPKIPGVLASAFSAVSCTSASACTAVGVYSDSPGVQVILVEVLSGTSWSIETAPDVSGAQISSLSAVSCTSAKKCVAVGGSEDSSGTVSTLVESRKGTAWSIVSSPNASGGEGSVLNGVSCTSTSSCTSVGAYNDSSGNEFTLAEAWNGTAWSIETTPNPSGAEGTLFKSVACTSTSSCTAVGGYDNSSGAESSLAEDWNGSAWSLDAVPNPVGTTFSAFGAVACASAQKCIAVGYSTGSSGQAVTLSEGWNGTSWSIQTTPNPSGALASAFAGVSCASAKVCSAVGLDLENETVEVALAEGWNGKSWSIQATIDPKGAQDNGLLGVSCTAADACTAVGQGGTYGLAERWNGSSWSIQATPYPAGAETTELSGVSCTSASACIAVGFSYSPGIEVTLAEVWNGTSWSIQPTPNPSGAPESVLYGVSCTSASSCTAVGYYTDSSGTDVTLAEEWNGTSWSIETTPDPSGAQESYLIGVSCISASACTAVGEYSDSSNAEFAVAEGWNGTSWSVEATPDPSGAEGSLFNGVACNPDGTCTAVGGYTDSSGASDSLAEAWNGTAWSVQTTPNPSGAEATDLSGVSCTSAGACTAVGGGGGNTLAEVWNGTSWSIQPTPNPSGALESLLNGVTCSSAAGCTAVGDYETATSLADTLVEVEPSP